jgi:hypothetical protein
MTLSNICSLISLNLFTQNLGALALNICLKIKICNSVKKNQ